MGTTPEYILMGTSLKLTLKRIVFFSTILFLAVGALSILLWFLFLIFAKEKEQQYSQILEKFKSESVLAISWDAVRLHPWKGLEVLAPAISREADFSRGLLFASAERIWIRMHKQQIIMELQNPVLYIPIEGGTLSVAAKEQFRKLSEQNKNWKIESGSGTANIILTDGTYHKKNISLKISRSHLEYSRETLRGSFAYHSQEEGKGKVNYSLDTCEKACLISSYYVYWKGENFKAEFFNWWLRDHQITDGIIEGKFALQRSIDSDSSSLTGNITLSDFKVADSSGNQFYFINNLSAAIHAEKKAKSLALTSSGDLEKSNYQLSGKWDNSLSWPRQFSVKLQPQKPDYRILFSLPGGMTTRTIPDIEFSLEPGQNGAIPAGHISFHKTEIAANNFPDIDIPELELQFASKEVRFKTTIQTGQSDLALSGNGSVELLPFEFIPVDFPLMRGYDYSRKRQEMRVSSQLMARATAKNIYTEDIRPFFDAFANYREESILKGLEYTWLPSRLRDRLFFRQFLETGNYTLDIQIDSYNHAPKVALPVSGQIRATGIYSSFLFESPGTGNFLKARLDYPSNIPYLSGELGVNSTLSGSLLDKWLPSHYISEAEKITGSYKFASFGERFADLYINHRGYGIFVLENVRGGAFAKETNLPEIWNTVDLSFERIGSTGTIRSVLADNPSLQLSATGTWTTPGGLSEKIVLRHSLRLQK